MFVGSLYLKKKIAAISLLDFYTCNLFLSGASAPFHWAYQTFSSATEAATGKAFSVMKMQCYILYMWLNRAAELNRLLLRACNLHGKVSSSELLYWR